LDSASERAYQPVLISALLHSGFSVLHNTSHNMMELGKDVVVRDPHGKLLALQLKGNPSTRLSTSGYHDILPQLMQLIINPIPKIISGKLAEKHIPILVTNGEIEEAVQHAIETLNSSFPVQYPAATPLEVWNRGKLLNMFCAVAENVWPTDLDSQIALLSALASNPKKSAAEFDVQNICTSTLKWNEKPSNAAALQRISGLGLIISIYVSNYLNLGNYFEAIKVKTIALGIVAGYIEKYKLVSKKIDATYTFLRNDLFSLLSLFSNGIVEHFDDKPFLNKNPFDEFGILAARKSLVTALLAINFLNLRSDVSDQMRAIICAPINYKFLLSERLVPSFLAIFWAKEFLSSTRENDLECVRVLASLINGTKNGTLPSPYYSLEEVVKWHYKTYLGARWHEIDHDDQRHLSHFARTIHALLAKRNWKQTCKFVWPDLTRTMEVYVIPDDYCEFAFAKIDNASEQTKAVTYPMTWDTLLIGIQAAAPPKVPKLLLQDKSLLLLLAVFLPYRATYDVVMHLDKEWGVFW
jgi:hypothetical protein